MTDYVIKTNKVNKAYGALMALKNVNMHVKRGSIYGLVGDNGAGKSTLLKLLAGHTFPTSGEVMLFNKTGAKQLAEARLKIGFLIEEVGFFPEFTVAQVLRYYSIQRGVAEKSKVDEMIQLVGLEEKSKSKCRSLSQGQKQRLGLAIAMIGEPQVLILDEPINGLDPSGIVELRNLLYKLNVEKNITIVLSSHILSELEQIATNYGFLNKGVLIQEISAEALQRECGSTIDISVSQPEQFAVLLERRYPDETFKVLPNKTIRIVNPKADAEVYSQLAFENQMNVIEVLKKQKSLEDYYIELKKGEE